MRFDSLDVIINLAVVSSKYRCSQLHSLDVLRTNRQDDKGRCSTGDGMFRNRKI